MSRKFTIDELKTAVNEAYEKYKDLDKGEVNPIVNTVNPNAYGITVMLTDGTTVNRGDTNTAAALGDIANLAVHAVLLQQNTVKELYKKAGKTSTHEVRKLKLPVSAHGLRAYSAVIPQNDADGKYDIIADNLVNMLGSAPDLDDKLYENLTALCNKQDVINKLAAVGYELYDDANIAVNGYTKLESLTVTTTQLAQFGATIAADGRNPKTGEEVFDGTISAPLTTIAAIHGNTDRNRRWLLKAGVPAVFSFAGMVLAIMPGVGAIAAYSPEVGKHGRSKKGARAVAYITRAIGYNIFGSAKVEYDKKKAKESVK